MVMESLQYISILIEMVIAILGVVMIFKKRVYGWFFLITFGIYAFYDIVRLNSIEIGTEILYVSFFIATLSALVLTWKVYNKK